MNHAILVFMATSLALSAGKDAAKANTNDLAMFHGTWQLISAEKRRQTNGCRCGTNKIKVVIKGPAHGIL